MSILNNTKNVNNTSLEINKYNKTFTQKVPKYAIRDTYSRDYTTINKPLNDNLIINHLQGNLTLATLGRWYTEAFYIDIDNNRIDLKLLITSLRKQGITNKQFLIIQSSTTKNYHIFFKVLSNGTINTLNYSSYTLKKLLNYLKTTLNTQAIELYPHNKKLFRLPYSADYRSLLDLHTLKSNYIDYDTFMYQYDALEYLELTTLKLHDFTNPLFIELNNKYSNNGTISQEITKNIKNYSSKGWYNEGSQLLNSGLLEPSTRHISQAKIIYYLKCNNITPLDAFTTVRTWLKTLNNGYSRDWNTKPQKCLKELSTQIEYIYNHYDTISNPLAIKEGAFDKNGLIHLITSCNGNLPMIKFGFNLFGYLNSRTFKDKINVHSDLLIKWGSWYSYLDYLNHFIEKGFIKRNDKYSNTFTRSINGLQGSGFSKSIEPTKEYKNLLVPTSKLILDTNNQGFTSYEDLITNTFTQQEYRQLLINNTSIKYKTASKQSIDLFKIPLFDKHI